MDNNLIKAKSDLKNILDELSKLLNARLTTTVELSNAAMKSLNAHLLLVTSPADPKTVEEMTARIELSKKLDEAEQIRIATDSALKDINEKIEILQKSRIAAEAEVKKALQEL